MVEISIKINGSSWTVKVITEKQMRKQLDEDQDLASGLTVFDEKTIYLDEDFVDYTTIVHELVHAYASDLHLKDTNELGLDDLEEIYASFFSAKGEKIISQAKRILKKLHKKLEENK